MFFTELLSLCEADDAALQKLPCYKAITKLVPLRKSALRALSACHYIPECREKIFQVLYHKALNSNDNELVEAGYECMKKFISGFQVRVVEITCNVILDQDQVQAIYFDLRSDQWQIKFVIFLPIEKIKI